MRQFHRNSGWLSGCLALALIALLQSTIWSQQPDAAARVAVLTFESREDYRSYSELGEELAMFFTAEIAGMDNVELVERGADSVLWDEFSLNRLTGDDANVAAGEAGWVNADIIVRGRFDRYIDRRLNIEIIDAANADVLARHTFEDIASLGSIESAQTRFRTEFGAKAGSLLQDGIQRKKALRSEVRIAPLFFQNGSKNRRLDHLEEPMNDWFLDEVEKFAGVTPLRFGGHGEALDEQALALMGFSQSQPDRWRRMADYFIWGEFEELPGTVATDLDDLQLEFKLRWLARDGREGALAVERMRLGDFEAKMRQTFASLNGSVVTRMQASATAADVDLTKIAKEVSDQLFERAAPLCPTDLHATLGLEIEHRYANASYAAHLMQAACLLDPADKRKEYARLSLRAELAGSNGRRRPDIPAVCLRYFLDNLSWIERNASSAPDDDKLKASATVTMIKEIAGLLEADRDWSGEIDLYVSAAERGFAHVREKLITDPAGLKSLRHITVEDFGVDTADRSQTIPLSSGQRTRLLSAIWKALPESQRDDFVQSSYSVLLEIENELGHQALVGILSEPAPGETVDSQQTSTSSTSPPDSSITNPLTKPKNRYHRASISPPPVIVRAPKAITFSTPYLTRTDSDFADKAFFPIRISRSHHQVYQVSGYMDKANTRIRKGGTVSGAFSLSVDLKNKRIRINGVQNSGRGTDLKSFLKSRAGRPLHSSGATGALWSSDGTWCIDRTSGRRTTGRDASSEMILERWTPATDEHLDLSPADAKLLNGTQDAKALIDDRWVYLIGVGETSIRFNVLDLNADEIQWQTFESTMPDFSLDEKFEISQGIRSGALLTTSGEWLMIRTAQGAAILRHGDTELRSAAPLFRTIFTRERETRRTAFAEKTEFRERRYSTSDPIGEAKVEPELLDLALADMEMKVQRIVGGDDGFYVLHNNGVSRIATVARSTKGKDPIRDTRMISPELAIRETGPEWRFRNTPSHIALTDDYCVVGENRSSYSYLHLIDREDGRYLGAVYIPSIELEQLVVQGDESFVFGRNRSTVINGPELRPVVGHSVEALASNLATPEKFSLPSPKAKPKSTTSTPTTSPRDAVANAIAERDIDALKALLENDTNHYDALSYKSIVAAVGTGDTPTILALIEHGANVNHTELSTHPAWSVEEESGSWGLRPRYARAPSPLVLAAQRNDRAMVDLLLDNGAYAQLKDLRFRTAIDFASDERLKQHMTERCERQIRLEEMLPVAANYIGYPFYSNHPIRTPESIKQAFSDALNADLQLAYVSMENGHSLLHALVAIEAKRAPKGKDGSYDLSDTIFPLVPDLDFNAPDARGRNILTQELAPADREELDTKFAELALQLGCNPHLKDDRGLSALDYIEKQLNTAPKSISESMNKRSKLSRIRKKFQQIPTPAGQ